MIPRLVERELIDVLAESRVTFLSGPRQSGKSTLVRSLAAGPWRAEYVTLDDGAVGAAAAMDPEGFLRGFTGPLAVDEAQRVPGLLLAVKQVVDADLRPGRFLLTGSADVLLLPRIAEASRRPLAGNEPGSTPPASGVR
jgi:uncharacterized protein